MRSGYINIAAGCLRSVGIGGRFRASTASVSNYAGIIMPSTYNLDFNLPGADSSNGPHDRWRALPLRYLKYYCSTLNF